MIGNYLRVALRNLLKHRAYSFINIVGLAVGLACCILIVCYDQYELSYDRSYPTADRVYRPTLRGLVNNAELNMALSCAPMSGALKRNIPEVEASTRLADFGNPVLRYKDKVFSEERFFRADSTFFQVFPTPFIEGDPKTALSQPTFVVITESMAKKYFGTEDPMGKILNADRRVDYQVTGVVKDVPANSHFHYDFLAGFPNLTGVNATTWLSNNFYTYILVHEGTDQQKLQKQVNDLVKSYVGPQIQAAIGVTYEQMEAAGNHYGYILQPLTSIHLQSHLDHEIEANGDASYLLIFSAIAISILLIACINFMNLATARSERRAKEVGIRKTLGSNRVQLIRQFMFESILMSTIAVILAVILVELFLPFFNELAGKEVAISLFRNPATIPLLAAFAFVVGILAGSYPAIFLSSFKPVNVLKSDSRRGSAKSILRSGLVVLQFAVTILLLIGTIIVYGQLEYIQSKKLGFDKEHLVILSKMDDIGSAFPSFKHDIMTDSRIISVTNMTSIPGRSFGDNAFMVEGAGGNDVRDVMVFRCDYDFLGTYKAKMAQGRFFSIDHPSDSSAIVINETAAKVFGLTSPIGMHLQTPGLSSNQRTLYEIIGVVKDFNFESLHQQIRPLAIGLFPRNPYGSILSVKIAAGDPREAIATLEKAWHKYAGDQAFEYTFLDQDLARLYRADQRTGRIVTTFSILAILIACLGLLGLVAFVTERRTKEIGIRKVLGASVGGIVGLLTREFVLLVIIANVIAWPTAYYILNHWLQNFAYRIDLDVWSFAVAGVVALLVAFLTLSFQSIKAALANPVESLRYE